MSQSQIVMTALASRLEARVRKDAFAFLQKLSEDDAIPGLNIEPVKNARDPKVRTGRVNKQYRAVLFKLTGADMATYVVHGIFNHDDAYVEAERVTLTVNPVNGITEIRVIDTPAEPPAPSAAPTAPAPTAELAPAAPQDVPQPPPAAPQPALTVTAEALVAELGIPIEVAEHVVTLDDAALADHVERQPVWVAHALLDLATGGTLDEVIDRYGARPTATARPEDEALLEGLSHPAAQMSFKMIEANDELEEVLEASDWGAWRTFLHPDQRRFVDQDLKGPSRLSGGAGTGKTVVLVHRCRRLARANPDARVVLTTFTANLSTTIAELDPSLVKASGLAEPGVLVSGVDALALAVLRRAGDDIVTDVDTVLGHPRTDIHHRTDSYRTWQDALSTDGTELPAELRNATFLTAEYETVILSGQINSREQYLRARRSGRGVRLGRRQREAVWQVVSAYRSLARARGSIDFAEAAAIAGEHLRRTGQPLVDHLLVDEGQDLSGVKWAFLRALVAEGPNDLFIAEDSHQRIYGQRVTLSHHGINVRGRRSAKLRLNYRTTRENLDLALKVLSGADYVDLEDQAESTEGYRSARSGPVPQILPVRTLTDELDQAADLVRGWRAEAATRGLGADSIAILVRDARQRDRVVSALAERDVTVRAIDRERGSGDQPVVMTMHRAKGMEFSRVLLFGLNEKSVPISLRDYEWSPEEEADAFLRERSLVYVAATRARDELALSWSGEASPLLDQAIPLPDQASTAHPDPQEANR